MQIQRNYRCYTE
jgi:hypothetical protein